MHKNSKIYIAGHTGMVGSAILRKLQAQGYTNLIYRTHAQLDLLNQQQVNDFFASKAPEYVFLAAAKVGGIYANNTYRADFIYQNLQIQNNVIHASYVNKVRKLLFLGSSCIYPKNAPQPIQEDALLTGELENTNEPYAIAKIAGIKMCESYNIQYGTNYIAVMPTNLYGEHDNFNLETSHVLPAIIRKCYLAKMLDIGAYEKIAANLAIPNNFEKIIEQLKRCGIYRDGGNTILTLWGSGNVYREFLHVDDMADACLFVMENINFHDLCHNLTLHSSGCLLHGGNPHFKATNLLSQEIKNTHLNIGSGVEITIKVLANMIANYVGYDGKIEFDLTHPDGAVRKLEDVSKMRQLGWVAKISLQDGLQAVVNNYISRN